MAPPRWAAWLVLVATATTSVTPARARDPVAAEALFLEARDAARRGDHASACPKFAESQRLGPAVGTLLNLALCEEKLGRVATAWQHLRQVIDQLPPGDDRIAFARATLATLEPRLPRLTLALDPSVPDGAVVLRDGVVIGQAGLGSAIPIDPGEHLIELRVPGQESRVERVTITEGERLALTLRAAAPPPARVAHEPAAPVEVALAPRRAASSDDLPPMALGGWIALGVGAAGLAVGAVTGGLALDRKSVMDRHCDAASACDPEGLAAAESGAALATAATFSTVLGLAAIATGGVLLLASPADDGEVSVSVPAGGQGRWGADVRVVY